MLQYVQCLLNVYILRISVQAGFPDGPREARQLTCVNHGNDVICS